MPNKYKIPFWHFDSRSISSLSCESKPKKWLRQRGSSTRRMNKCIKSIILIKRQKFNLICPKLFISFEYSFKTLFLDNVFIIYTMITLILPGKTLASSMFPSQQSCFSRSCGLFLQQPCPFISIM